MLTKLTCDHTGIMLDLETLAVTGAPAILAVGLVVFQWRDGKMTVFRRVYLPIRVSEWTFPGLRIEADTLRWWLQQPEEARRAITDPTVRPSSLMDALETVDRAIRDAESQAGPVLLWAKGVDWQWLASVAEVMAPGWRIGDFRDVRDVRQELDRAGIDASKATHHALDDARAQVADLERAWAK